MGISIQFSLFTEFGIPDFGDASCQIMHDELHWIITAFNIYRQVSNIRRTLVDN